MTSAATPLLQQPNTLTATGQLDASRAITIVHLSDGRAVELPTNLLLANQDILLDDGPRETAEGTVVPVIEERLHVGKRQIETGKVTLEKLVHEYEETLDVPLAMRSFDVERVIINKMVEVAPAIRHEGLTTIYPIVEEQLILTTQLLLKEELHVTQRDTEHRDTRTISLKRESIEVTRTPLDEPASRA